MYEKTTWANGDIITAEKLNHMEDGIQGNAVTLTVTITYDYDSGTLTCDKTYQDLYDFISQHRYSFEINLRISSIEIEDGEPSYIVFEDVGIAELYSGSEYPQNFEGYVIFDNNMLKSLNYTTESISGDYITINGCRATMNGYAILTDNTVKSLATFDFPLIPTTQ